MGHLSKKTHRLPVLCVAQGGGEGSVNVHYSSDSKNSPLDELTLIGGSFSSMGHDFQNPKLSPPVELPTSTDMAFLEEAVRRPGTFSFSVSSLGTRAASSASFCGTGLGSEGCGEVLREREGVVGRTSRKLERKDEHEGRSGTDNMDDVSGNDQVAADNPPRKKRYHRHALRQIQEFEALLQECLHPGEKQRLRLRKRLCLETR